MKKISFIALLFVAFVCLNSCESDTPEEDTTKLWPAQTDTCALWGYINEKGEMVIPPQYMYAAYFSGGKACVYFSGGSSHSTSSMAPAVDIYWDWKQAFINKKGKIVHEFPITENADLYFYYGCCIFHRAALKTGVSYTEEDLKKTGYGLYDTYFNELIPPSSSFIQLGRMTKDGLMSSWDGYINKHGKVVIPKRNENGVLFGQGENFCDGVAVIQVIWYDSLLYNHKYSYGAIDTKGKLVIDTIYKSLRSVGASRLEFQLDDSISRYNEMFGLMDTKGNVIMEPTPFVKYSFYGDGGLMPVGKGNCWGDSERKWGYIDKNGEWRIPCQYYSANPFREGVAWVRIEEDKYTLIDLQGNTLLTLQENQYPSSTFRNGLCLICESTYEKDAEHYSYKDEYKYIDKKGNTVYSWIARSENYYYSPDANKTKKELSEDEMLLKHFEGTEYYPLAEQCVRSKKLREEENLKK